MHARNVVINRDQTKVLSIPIKDRVKAIEHPVSVAPYSDNSHNPAYFTQKAHANKHIQKQEKLHGI